MMQNTKDTAPAWVRQTLKLAAIYNLSWGAAVILMPLALFEWAGMSTPQYPEIWQCVGMIVGVYGVGYWIASWDPFRHWPIILVGLVGKILGPIGFLDAASRGNLPWRWGATIVTNDLIWWLPFAAILYLAFRHNSNSALGSPKTNFRDAIRTTRSHRNASLQALSEDGPVLVVFLRHGGCVFCHETLARLERVRTQIALSGTQLALVHMGRPMDGTLMAQQNRLQILHHFSDPHCQLYRAFGLGRGGLRQLFSLRILARGVRALLQGHRIGPFVGDGFRMPGAFLLRRGEIIEAHRADFADEIPDFLAMISGTSPSCDVRVHAPRTRRFAMNRA